MYAICARRAVFPRFSLFICVSFCTVLTRDAEFQHRPDHLPQLVIKWRPSLDCFFFFLLLRLILSVQHIIYYLFTLRTIKYNYDVYVCVCVFIE